jgi:hypothetical protein
VKNKIVTSNNENKRSISSSSSSPSQSPHVISTKKTKLFFAPNRFASLSTNDNDTAADNEAEIDTQPETSNQGQQNTTNATLKIILPPPIFIKGVHDYLGLRNHLTEVTAPDSFSCNLTTNHQPPSRHSQQL